MMRKIHFREPLLLKIPKQAVNPEAVFDFKGGLLIDGDPNNIFCFSKSGENMVNCRVTEDYIVVYATNHNLLPGPLLCVIDSSIPDPEFENGRRDIAVNLVTGVELVRSFPLGGSGIVVESIPAWTKGEPGKPDIPMRFMTASQYEALGEYDDGTLYFIIED